MCQAFGQRSIRAITKLIYKNNIFRGLLPRQALKFIKNTKIFFSIFILSILANKLKLRIVMQFTFNKF